MQLLPLLEFFFPADVCRCAPGIGGLQNSKAEPCAMVTLATVRPGTPGASDRDLFVEIQPW